MDVLNLARVLKGIVGLRCDVSGRGALPNLDGGCRVYARCRRKRVVDCTIIEELGKSGSVFGS